jgi:hypothetical protein
LYDALRSLVEIRYIRAIERHGRRSAMRRPTSVTTEDPEQRRKGSGSFSKGTPKAAIDDIEAAFSDDERPSRGPWPSEIPPTGMLTGMIGELSFYYGACWRHYRSAQR